MPNVNINDDDIQVQYVLVSQPNRTQRKIITSKSRFTKHKLSIPEPELVATHMAANLAYNIKAAQTMLKTRNRFGFTFSTVMLHWL